MWCWRSTQQNTLAGPRDGSGPGRRGPIGYRMALLETRQICLAGSQQALVAAEEPNGAPRIRAACQTTRIRRRGLEAVRCASETGEGTPVLRRLALRQVEEPKPRTDRRLGRRRRALHHNLWIETHSSWLLYRCVAEHVDLKKNHRPTRDATRVNTRIHDHSIHRRVPGAPHIRRAPDRTFDPTRDALGGGGEA